MLTPYLGASFFRPGASQGPNRELYLGAQQGHAFLTQTTAALPRSDFTPLLKQHSH